MFCIKCRHPDTRVINSRPSKKRANVWRRRKCINCGYVFTTIEAVATDGHFAVLGTDSSAPFSVMRLAMSIAPQLSEQSSAPDDAYWLATTILEKILSSGSDAIASKELASTAFIVIERFDSNAALKYALDHRLTHQPASRAKRPRLR